MARTLSSFKQNERLGRVVYRYGTPRSLGRIVRVVDDRYVDVFWISKKFIASAHVLSLRDFEALVEETEQKAKNHREALKFARRAPLK